MDGIFCDNCGAELNEAPTLPPDQRPPCPRCNSLARRFEQETTDQITVSDSGTGIDTFSVAKSGGAATIAHAQSATVTITAHDATARTEPEEARSGAAMAQARVEGRSSGVRGLRRVTDQLVVMARLLVWTPLTGHLPEMSRSLWWTQLSEQPTWMVEVADEAWGLIDGGIELENDQIDALLGVAESLLPSGAGPWLLAIRDQAGEKIAGGLGYDSIEGLAALAEFLLPRHPG